MLSEFEKTSIGDTLYGWELVEFLGVSIEDILLAAEEYGWINEENEEDVKEWIGLK